MWLWMLLKAVGTFILCWMATTNWLYGLSCLDEEDTQTGIIGLASGLFCLVVAFGIWNC